MSSGRSEASFLVDDHRMPVIVQRYARAKGYRLRYDAAQDRLLLSMPARGSMRAALQWAQTQEDWVRGRRAVAPKQSILVPGAVLPIEGIDYRIDWDRAHARTPVISSAALLVGGPLEQVGARVTRWLRGRALEVLTRETHLVAAREALHVVSVRVADPRSRWGSCSSDGSIRYSWRLILAPPEVRLATVAHEVAHLLHMDHSAAFHAAHARLLGHDPAPARRWLRANGARLHSIRA